MHQLVSDGDPPSAGDTAHGDADADKLIRLGLVLQDRDDGPSEDGDLGWDPQLQDQIVEAIARAIEVGFTGRVATENIQCRCDQEHVDEDEVGPDAAELQPYEVKQGEGVDEEEGEAGHA